MKARSAALSIGCVLALWSAMILPAPAASLSFAWDANTEPDLAGYKLFIGPSSGNYTNHIVLGKVTSHTIPNLVNGSVYYFALSAVNSNGLESDLSAELRYPNLPPAIANIADRTINEDATEQTVSLTGITPGAGETQTLQITAASSNPSLIPHPTVNYTSGSSGTLRFTPAANANGVATITVTLDDGQTQNNTATETFTVTVTLVNDSPTLGAIADQSVAEDVPATVPLQVADVDTPANSLVFRATSSNATLAPTNNITFPGSGTNRSVTVTPAANQTGTATITVIVSDGALSTNRSFTLTVGASPDAPSISTILPVTTSEDIETALIPFTVSDPDTATTNLTVRVTTSNASLIPTNRIILAGSNGSRTIRLRPTTNQHGSAAITLTVSDGTLSSSTQFDFTVLSVNDSPTISAVTDRTLQEDQATQFIPFTVWDAETASNNLVVTVVSSDHTVVPLTNISLAITPTNRTIRILPLANVSGTATITLTVSDGEASASEPFTVTYLALNDAPYVSQPPDLTINKQNPPPPIPFTVGDVDSPLSSLAITFYSTNFTMQRVTNMVLSGTGSNRVLTLTPTPGQTGTSLLSINVSDGAATNTVYFRFTITGSNNPPVLTVPGTLAGNAGASIPIPGLRVSDLDVGTNNLNFTLTAPNGTLTVSTTITAGVKAAQVSGNNSSAVTIIAPLAALNTTLTNANGVAYVSRADFGGTETLVVSVSDNGHAGLGGPQTDTENVAIQVTGASGNNLEVWRARYFSAADLQDPTKEATVWGDLADPDADGRHNLMEFALGLNPLGSEPQETALISQTVNVGGNQFLTLTFNARINEPLLQYIPEVSADNATWSATTQRTSVTPVNAEFERVTYQDTVPITAASARFIRLRVVKNSP